MENVRPGWWNFHYQASSRRFLLLRLHEQLHLPQQVGDVLRGKLNTNGLADVLLLHLKLDQVQVWIHAFRTKLVHDIDRLHGERLGAVLGEHGDHRVENHVRLRVVRRRAFDENVLGVQSDRTVGPVDDWGQTQHGVVAVVNHWEDGGVLDNVQVLLELLIRFVELHQVFRVEVLRLLKRSEDYLLRRQRLVSERPLQGVQVVSSNGDERSLPAKVLVQFVLQVYETLVGLGREGHVSQRRANHVRPYQRSLRLYVHGLDLVSRHHFLHERRRLLLPLENSQRSRDALQA
mmetsp:Transcript_2877/g.4812  ORF Transcript_2877/g.4812 Transcript_2877/m.4812 type:complete len:290 (-) Transcript_2877:299-1168(-)